MKRMNRPSQNEDKIPKAMSRDQLAKALFESLKDISLEDFVRLLTNETEEIIQYYGLTRGYKGCQRMSLLFNPHRLSTKANVLYQALQRRLKTKLKEGRMYYAWLQREMVRGGFA